MADTRTPQGWALGDGTSPARADNQPQTLMTLELIYDATTEFMKQVDRAIVKSRQTANSTGRRTHYLLAAEALPLIIVALMTPQGAIWPSCDGNS